MGLASVLIHPRFFCIWDPPNIDGLGQLWRLWQLRPYSHNGHIRDMAIVTIDAIVDPCYRYRCLKKRLDLRIGASEADLPNKLFEGEQLKIHVEIFVLYTCFWNV